MQKIACKDFVKIRKLLFETLSHSIRVLCTSTYAYAKLLLEGTSMFGIVLLKISNLLLEVGVVVQISVEKEKVE